MSSNKINIDTSVRCNGKRGYVRGEVMGSDPTGREVREKCCDFRLIGASGWPVGASSGFFLLFFWSGIIISIKSFVGAAQYPVVATNLQFSLQIWFVRAAGQPSLQISDLLQRCGRGGWQNHPCKSIWAAPTNLECSSDIPWVGLGNPYGNMDKVLFMASIQI
jgi:hypothetical protein